MDLPIACSLTESELRERRRTILMSMQADVVATIALPNGYRYEFEAKPDILSKLAELVSLEHACCRFLTFKIIVESGDTPVRLEVTGPPQTKDMIANFFGA